MLSQRSLQQHSIPGADGVSSPCEELAHSQLHATHFNLLAESTASRFFTDSSKVVETLETGSLCLFVFF